MTMGDVQRGSRRILLVSGKMGAGKDTIAEPLAHALWPDRPVLRMAYADALRDEVDKIVQIIKTTGDNVHRVDATDGGSSPAEPDGPFHAGDAAHEISKRLRCGSKDARGAVEILSKALAADPGLNAHQHNVTMREMLQYWGTQVRRSRDEDYWTRLTGHRIQRVLRDSPDVVVVLTDGRFPNEVDLIHRLGGVTVRLDVSRDVQLQRLACRDGAIPDPAKLDHVSETSLDGYDDFDHRVDVSWLDPSGVVWDCASALASIVS